MNRALILLVIILNFWQPLLAKNLSPIRHNTLRNLVNVDKDQTKDPNYIAENTFIDLNEDDELTNTGKQENTDQSLNQHFVYYSKSLSLIAQGVYSSKPLFHLSRPIYLLVGVFQI